MENTIVGVYDSYAQAQNAVNELLSAGFSRSDVQLNPDADRTAGQTAHDTDSTGGGSGIGNFFRSLFGMEEHHEHRDAYSEAVRRGSCVLTVNAADDKMRDRATEIMNRYDPIDIDERASQWRNMGWAGYDESAPAYTTEEIDRERAAHAQSRNATGTITGMSAGSVNPAGTTGDTTGTTSAASQNIGEGIDTTRIPVVEEEIKVGKREVERGGVRVYQRIRETPVTESVTLREEHVRVERHPVDEPASEADLSAIKEGAVEMRETAEEPVVSKSARVVEEVVVGKEATERTEDINDTVRRTDVEVEQLSGADATGRSSAGRGSDYADTMATSDDSDYRNHWQTAYGSSGGRYEDYDAAYRYGSTAASSGRYKNYRWEDAEPDMRSDWERSHPESTWDKVKDAVRYGAERVSGRHH